jgi:membrane protein implicated in regulation of membrane protease activity
VTRGDSPPRIRPLFALYCVGAVVSALGIIGFFVSFTRVAGPAAAAIDVHTDMPWFAYGSMAAWIIGVVVMWLTRRAIEAWVRESMQGDGESQADGLEAALVDPAAIED